MYTKEEFLKRFDEWSNLNSEFNKGLSENPGPVDLEQRGLLEAVFREMWEYGVKLVEQNPSDREIVCMVYSSFSLQAPNLYEILSDELKNDKLVTMLALKKFDSTAYSIVGERLRYDKEVMYLLLTQTSDLLAITQFSPELAYDPAFWQEIFESRYECLKSESGDGFRRVLFEIDRMNNDYQLSLDMNMINNQFYNAMSKPSRYSNLDVMGLYNSGWTCNPHIVQEIIHGNQELIDKCIPISSLREELLNNNMDYNTNKEM